MIEEIENRLGYIFKGMRGEYFVFACDNASKEKLNYHHYEKIPCRICGKPYMKRRWQKTTAHLLCSNREIIKTRDYGKERLAN